MNIEDPFREEPDCLTPTLIMVICLGIAAISLASALVTL